MRIPVLLLIVTLIGILLILSGCSQQGSVWQQEISKAAMDGKYTLLYIYDSSIAESPNYREDFRMTSLEIPEFLTYLEADYKVDKSSLDTYLEILKPTSLPFAVLIAPNGAITGSYYKPCSVADLTASVVSTKESEILLSLQDGRIAILCVYSEDLEAFKYIETKLSEVGAYFTDKVAIHYLNPASNDDKAYLAKMAMPIDKSMVYIMVPTGDVIAKYPLDEVNIAELMDLILEDIGTN